jgi:HEAT repeat protein
MAGCNNRALQLVCLIAAAGCLLVGNLHAQDSASAPHDEKTHEPLIEQLRRRLERVEGELARLKAEKQQIPTEKSEQTVLALLETPYLGSLYAGSAREVRYFAARMIFVNLTPQSVTVKRENIRLVADGKIIPLGEIPKKIQHHAFQTGAHTYQLRHLMPAPEVEMASGGTGSTWVVFPEVPPGRHVPTLVLQADVPGKTVAVDVNEFALGLLRLKVERIGPRARLALLTISGEVNTVNIGSLIDTLDRLKTEQISRAVIRWTDSAAPLDVPLRTWLEQSAAQAGRGQTSSARFPEVPARIRELHLASLPNPSQSPSRRTNSQAQARIHETDMEAVSAALQSAYEVLPRSELLREIEQGHPLTRAAALAGGGGRLPGEKVPLLLKYVDDDDPQLQRAAIFALRHFGEQQAIDKLISYARKNAEPLASAAIESLAASRYAAAHESLLELLKNEPPLSRKRIVTLLARHPRPIWSETIYEFLQEPDPAFGIEALRALNRIGHPQLVDVLKRSLEQSDAALQAEAFRLLAARTDPQSEALALNHTLAYMQDSPPNPQMLTLLNRTKDRRAIELLVRYLDQPSTNRSTMIDTLARIGDQSVAAVLAEKYDGLKNYEKTAALKALLQLRSPKFRELAGSALHSADSALISTACKGLQSEGSPEAVGLLVNALDTATYATTWSHTAKALAVLGTSDARSALRKTLASEIDRKRKAAAYALQSLLQRSPGFQYLQQAQQHRRQKKWKEALAQYALSLEMDPQLPEAYTGRANIYLHQRKLNDAKADFTTALEMNPHDSQAVAGKAIVLVLEGSHEQGITFVEASRSKFVRDSGFAYNSACVYARALESVRGDESISERDKKMEQYRQTALSELKRSVKLGFRDFEWMKEDPDLKSLHGLDEFNKLHISANDGDG